MTARTLYRRELRRRQRAIVRAPRGRKNSAAKALRDWTHELLEATVEARGEGGQ